MTWGDLTPLSSWGFSGPSPLGWVGFPPEGAIAQKSSGFVTQWNILEKEMATHSSIFAGKTPWTEEPGGLQSMGSQRVAHD